MLLTRYVFQLRNWAKTLVSKEALKSFQRGVGFLIRWQCFLSGPDFYGVGLVMVLEVSHVFIPYGWCYMLIASRSQRHDVIFNAAWILGVVNTLKACPKTVESTF